MGHTVTVKLRNNGFVEGIFHSCSVSGDFSITLKNAKRMDEDSNGEITPMLVIPGKDFLQVSAVDVPPVPEAVRGEGRAFAIDSEISKRSGDSPDEGRELVPWQGGSSSAGIVLEDTGTAEPWCQFEIQEKMFGISTTYSEDLYTTKLDPGKISNNKREEADRIAREIAEGPNHASREERLNGEDEEAAFSSVPRGKSSQGGKGQQLAMTGNSGTLTMERLHQHDSAASGGRPQGPGEGFAEEHLVKRGIITAHSGTRQPIVSEMKRINALNLEPAMPKFDDKTRNDWLNFKQQKNSEKLQHGSGRKMEFQQDLQALQQRESRLPSSGGRLQSRPEASGRRPDGALGRSGDDSGRSKFSFNPEAKEFSFNPQASTFMPPQLPGAGSPMGLSQARQYGPPFPNLNKGGKLKNLKELLDGLFDISKKENLEQVSYAWAEATGPPCREVLGVQDGQPPAFIPPALVGPGGMPCGVGWQPQPQPQQPQQQQPQQLQQQRPQMQQQNQQMQQMTGQQQRMQQQGSGRPQGPQQQQQQVPPQQQQQQQQRRLWWLRLQWLRRLWLLRLWWWLLRLWWWLRRWLWRGLWRGLWWWLWLWWLWGL